MLELVYTLPGVRPPLPTRISVVNTLPGVQPLLLTPISVKLIIESDWCMYVLLTKLFCVQ